MKMPVSGLYDSGIIIPVPELRSKFVVSSRQASPKSSAASGEVTPGERTPVHGREVRRIRAVPSSC